MIINESTADALIKFIGSHTVTPAETWHKWFPKFETKPEYIAELRKIRRMHIINIKGYFNRIFYDAVIDKKFQDIKYGNGALVFGGTDDELDDYIEYLVKNEGELGFKII